MCLLYSCYNGQVKGAIRGLATGLFLGINQQSSAFAGRTYSMFAYVSMPSLCRFLAQKAVLRSVCNNPIRCRKAFSDCIFELESQNLVFAGMNYFKSSATFHMNLFGTFLFQGVLQHARSMSWCA